jgi:uncharacterized membrane protein
MNKRRAKSTRRRKRWFPRGLAAIALLVGVAAGALSWWLAPTYGCVAVNNDSDELLLNVDPLARGTAQKYCWKLPDRPGTIRFIVARRSDGAINVVLDACQACYLNNLGYRLSKGDLVCRFCGNRYSIDKLSVGIMSCRPVKLPFTVDRGLLRIRVSDLKGGTAFFPPQFVVNKILTSASEWLVGLWAANSAELPDAWWCRSSHRKGSRIISSNLFNDR